MTNDRFRMYAQLIVLGDTFSPSSVEKELAVDFYTKNEVGDIARLGKNRGKPLSYGSGTIEYDLEDDEPLPITPELISILRSHGAKEITVIVNVEHGKQCNFEFSAKMLAALAALGITVGISCYERD